MSAVCTPGHENCHGASIDGSIVTKEDVDTLKNDWLTDNIISFWEEYVSPATAMVNSLQSRDVLKPYRYLEREELIKFPSSHIVLLRPSMCFMLKETGDPLTLKDALPNFAKTSHIFLPINDNHNVEVAEGGSHWSLLVVSVIDGVAFHYDSLSSANREEAFRVTQKMERLLGKKLRFIDLRDSPQQENSSDCGVFVCVAMQHLLLDRLMCASETDKVSMGMGDISVNAAAGRRKILKLVEQFRKEGERRRSSKDDGKSPPRID
ncbi:MAG: hypothetical protein M1819_003657 [Sarea resinae]|nr:MAG: hypothetical protein M1819_003657 [Sarea resinae]